jgi:hypothetical protein
MARHGADSIPKQFEFEEADEGLMSTKYVEGQSFIKL